GCRPTATTARAAPHMPPTPCRYAMVGTGNVPGRGPFPTCPQPLVATRRKGRGHACMVGWLRMKLGGWPRRRDKSGRYGVVINDTRRLALSPPGYRDQSGISGSLG